MQEARDSAGGHRVAVERVDELSAQQFARHYVAESRPIIISRDRALRATARVWSLDYLISKHPRHNVSIEHYQTNEHRVGRWQYVDMEFDKYVGLIRSSSAARHSHYLAMKPLAETFPQTAGEVALPGILEGQRLIKVTTFAGVDTFSAAHYHNTPMEAVLAQMHGRKQLSLYSARQFHLLKPYPWYSYRSNWSQITQCEPDGTSLAVQATEYTCTLERGEMLFIPQGWFHTVRGYGESISVTHFFKGAWRHAHPRIAVRDFAQAMERTLLVRPLARLPLSPRHAHMLNRLGIALGVARE